MLSGKHSAGCEDVLSSGSPYSGHQAGIVQSCLEVFYYDIRRRLIWEIRYLVEADEVHAAFQPFQHPYQSIGMRLGVIESRKHRVLEAHSPLTCEVILLNQVYDILDRPCSLRRHHAQSLRSVWIMEADCQMALALVKVAFEVRKHTDRRKRDPLRAPCKSQSAVSISIALITFS